MRYFALATDYDGTLALHGHVDDETLAACERFRASGRKLVMVTGRELEDLMRVFPNIELFDYIVAENGALVYDPRTREIEMLGPPPPVEFVLELQRRNISPVSVGQVIVATWEPHSAAVFEVIRDMGLELQVILNKGAVMVLPSGINKATGLQRALDSLKLSAHNTVGVGDAENDHAFLAACECGVAVANALDSLKAQVDLVMTRDHGGGVQQLIDQIITTDLKEVDRRLSRYDLQIGVMPAGTDAVRLPAHGSAVLVAGPSGAGKSTVTTTLLERLGEAHYQFCIVDAEGDYQDFAGAIAIRSGGKPRILIEDVLRLLDRPNENAVVNLLDERLEDRPHMLQALLPALLELRAATGRPHWIVIDEAHHMLPAAWQPSETIVPSQLENLVLVTVHPDHLSSAVLALVDTLVIIGPDPQSTLDSFTRARGSEPIRLSAEPNDAPLAWLVPLGAPPVPFVVDKPAGERRRHRRKYAEGELAEDRSFYFKGPEGRLNLRAQNLEMFSQIAEGVDDETWLHHLRQRDVSQWFREAIKDPALAEEASAVEAQTDLTPHDSRQRIRAAIERRYTTPA